jgi:hypothetical protein
VGLRMRFSAGGGVVALKSHFVRLVLIVLELVGERARSRAMFPKLLSVVIAVIIDDL